MLLRIFGVYHSYFIQSASSTVIIEFILILKNAQVRWIRKWLFQDLDAQSLIKLNKYPCLLSLGKRKFDCGMGIFPFLYWIFVISHWWNKLFCYSNLIVRQSIVNSWTTFWKIFHFTYIDLYGLFLIFQYLVR